MLFSDADRIAPDELRVSDRRCAHLRNVHRAKVGDRLRVGEVNGLMGSAEILGLDARGAHLRVHLESPPPAKLPVTLVVALPRPKMLRRILRNATEFGVRDIHLIHSFRVEKSYWQSPVLAEPTLRDYLLQGLEQACDTQLPAVHLQRRFKPFAEDLLPALCANRQALLAHPGAHPACPARLQGEQLLVVGPEGGFIPFEVASLQAAGCRAVSLGTRILRVENAVACLLARSIAST
ncbi:MAG: 16S rRNA (uracil(1498)-N(3))-methyltransferase [Halioglobus sp.]